MTKAKVPAAIHQRIEAEIQRGLALIAKHYNVHLPTPNIVYEKRGNCAGVARGAAWEMDLNAELLMLHVDEFIARTPLHELAHLAQYKIYPQSLAAKPKRMTRTGRMKREKRDVHGAEWQEIMGVLGVNAKRTHNYDTSTTRKQMITYDYKCGHCNEVLKVSTQAHAKMQKGQLRYHRPCGRTFGVLLPLGTMNKPVGSAAKVVTSTTPAPTGDSKLAKCWRLYSEFNTRSRGWLISMFVGEADCTKAGAGTYYALCKKMWEQGVR